MSNETLELSEHELYFLPPGTPATAPATRVEVEGKVFLTRLIWDSIEVERYFIFHRRERSEEILVSSGRISGVVPEIKSEDEIKFIINTIEPTGGTRFWCSPHREYGIFITINGHFYVFRQHENTEGEWVYFRCETPWQGEQFAFYPQSKFTEFCQQMHNDANSVLHEALRWKELSPEQKDAIAFRCENGDWETMRHYFLLAAKIVTYRCGPFPLPVRGASLWKFDLSWPREDIPFALQWCSRWRITLCHIFRASFTADEPLFIKAQRMKQHWRCIVKCNVPTAHETLEAQLELREFLRPHFSDDEIEKLLHPPTN